MIVRAFFVLLDIAFLRFYCYLTKEFILGEDRMFFRFMGNYREQLWFSSPNFCGAFLCMTILGTIGIWLLGARIKHKGLKIIFY